MKKSPDSRTHHRLISIFLLPVIIPLWLTGWILSLIGSQKPLSQTTNQRNPRILYNKTPDNSEQEIKKFTIVS
jgi:hypothetical protein